VHWLLIDSSSSRNIIIGGGGGHRRHRPAHPADRHAPAVPMIMNITDIDTFDTDNFFALRGTIFFFFGMPMMVLHQVSKMMPLLVMSAMPTRWPRWPRWPE
jgi:hypothetical protein